MTTAIKEQLNSAAAQHPGTRETMLSCAIALFPSATCLCWIRSALMYTAMSSFRFSDRAAAGNPQHSG